MSYILEALKLADAERERGAAPGLHTRHQTPAGNIGTARGHRPAWVAAAAGLTLVMLTIAFWFWRIPDAPPMVSLTPAASPMSNTVVPAAPTLTMAPALTLPSTAPAAPVTPNTLPAAITPIAPVPLVRGEPPVAKAKPAEKASTQAVTVSPAVPSASTKDVAVNTATAPPRTVVSAPAPASTSARPVAIPLLSELPTELRSQIPKITITGSVYSDSPAQRLLLVNNLVMSQGDQVTPDLRLEEIQPRSSVLNFEGTRFRVMH